MEGSLQVRNMPVLVTGATGYVGGRLIPRLLHAGYRVRALVRDRERLQGRPWLSEITVVEGDVLQPQTLPVALSGVAVAYYLIHGAHGSFDVQDRDVTSARHFGQAACAAGVQRIVYLGALRHVTPHSSRQADVYLQIGAALREAGVPVSEFRAAPILGSGSITFEIVRNLTERLPVIPCPRWAYARVQPIAIRDILSYLIAALDTPQSIGQVIEIGGADVLSYSQMMMAYARARGLRRLFLPFPLLSPRLSASWLHWLTPIPADIARPLIEALSTELVLRDNAARHLFPQIQPLDYATALLLAVERTEAGQVETSWSDALATSQGEAPVVPLPAVSVGMAEGIIVEQRHQVVAATPERVFRIFTGLGGERGWLYADWAWRLRGIIDRLVGGVGFRRGRRHPADLYAGDALDFWRVERVEQNRLLRLRAEMKVPGRAWLEFQVHPHSDGMASLTQRAFFVPKGLLGLIYWYALYPLHSLIFSGLIREIARRAEQTHDAITGGRRTT